MLKKKFLICALSISLSLAGTVSALANTDSAVTVENCGAYLFEWRPMDYGNGRYFAILAGGGTLHEENVILNMGYDYAYTFNPAVPKPWGEVPDLAFVDGKWGIPENWAAMPEGSQPTMQIVLTTNSNDLSIKERYIDVVKLPNGISKADLPVEAHRYLINVDGSDAGANNSSTASGWIKESNGQYRYRKSDGTFVSNTWLTVDGKSYYMNPEGIMLADTITPDGIYVNGSGLKTNYIPGWKQDGKGWRYLMKNGNFAATTWIQDTDGKWYYFNLGTYMLTDTQTPDGFYVDANGVWDGQASTIDNSKSLGPGAV